MKFTYIIQEATKKSKYGLKTSAIGKVGRGLEGKVRSLDLPAGKTCPGAGACYGCFIKREDYKPGEGGFGNIINVPAHINTPAELEKWAEKHNVDLSQKFTCFAAVGERMPAVYEMRQKNYEILKSLNDDELVDALSSAIETIPKKHRKYFRLHTSGDFFNPKYLNAWIKVAKKFPDTKFYGYTKVIPPILQKEDEIPDNMNITLSYGGIWDDKVDEYAAKKIADYSSGKSKSKRKFKIAYVVPSSAEAKKRGLPIQSSSDIRAAKGDSDFAIVVHGNQIKNDIFKKDVEEKQKKYNTNEAFEMSFYDWLGY